MQKYANLGTKAGPSTRNTEGAKTNGALMKDVRRRGSSPSPFIGSDAGCSRVFLIICSLMGDLSGCGGALALLVQARAGSPALVESTRYARRDPRQPARSGKR